MESAYDSHRETPYFAPCKGSISSGECLVAGLLASVWIASTVSGVDNEVTEVFIIFIAPDSAIESAPSLWLPEIPA